LAALGGLGLVVAIAIGVVSFLSVSNIGGLTDERSALVTADQDLRQLDMKQSDLQIAERDMLLAINDSQGAEADKEYADGVTVINGAWKSVNALHLPDDVHGSLGKLQTDYLAWTDHVKARLPVLRKIQPGSSEAVKALNDERATANAVETEITDARTMLARRSTAAGAQVTGAIGTVQRTVIIVLVAGVLLLIGLSRWISGMVTGPLAQLASAADRLAAGDCSFAVTVTGTDEGGRALSAMDRTRTNIQALISDVRGLVEAALQGRLDARADADQHSGDFLVIVQGVNDTLDAIVAPVREVGRVLKAVEDGDLSQTIPATYQGQLEELRQATNNTVGSLAESFGEVTRVLKAVEEGDLTQTITATYRGQFEQLRLSTVSTVQRLAGTVADVVAVTDQLGRAADQISSASQSLSQAATEQASSVEETSASIEQMSASVSQNSENAKVTEGIAAKAATDAKRAAAPSSRRLP
jgi:methyl-accepting chemotaxis protein